jgi:2-octaprenyl-6-methoxyphenol hydroxylase
MNICIIGDGLTSLSLAKNLINKKINVHIYHKKNIKNLSSNRTIGITKDNLEFFKSEILNFSKKDVWAIKKIEIYSEKIKKKKLLNFENDKDLFYIIQNDHFYKLLNSKLLKNKHFKKKIIQNDKLYEKILNDKTYDLIINCDSDNFLSKKYFFKTINKDYNNKAYTTILEHEKLDNKVAIQIFTKFGPIAFLPISNSFTSVVYSIDVKNHHFNDHEILDLIKNNHPNLTIKNIQKLKSFKLKSSSLRNYYYDNVLAFGDVLHKIHPLAGQGFNMTIRDIKILSKIIQNKIDLGMQLDSKVSKIFEKEAKSKNFIFASGIDFIYEFFNFDKKINDKNLSKILRLLNNHKGLNNFFIKIADKGLNL